MTWRGRRWSFGSSPAAGSVAGFLTARSPAPSARHKIDPLRPKRTRVAPRLKRFHQLGLVRGELLRPEEFKELSPRRPDRCRCYRP